MRFDIYGRFQVDVRREGDSWEVYRLAPGKRARMDDIVIPATLKADEIIVYLDDIFHELASFGQRIAPMP